jgi:hypothetical protein
MIIRMLTDMITITAMRTITALRTITDTAIPTTIPMQVISMFLTKSPGPG